MHLYLLICEILSVVAFIDLVSQKKRSPTSMVAWLMAIVLLPYVSAPLYFVIGVRKRKHGSIKPKIRMAYTPESKAARFSNPITDVLTASGLRSPCANNGFTLIADGESAYAALMTRIRGARRSIYISTYVFRRDATTARIIEALCERARAGVEVKLLIDAIGSLAVYINPFYFRSLKKAGGSVRYFMPLVRNPYKNAVNLRNHRKIYMFDKHMVLTGGMNLGDEYMGPEPRDSRWGDLLFAIEGPAVCHLHNLFIADWRFATGQKLSPMIHAPPVASNHIIQIAPSGPDVEMDALFNALLSAIYTARQRVWIVTPYFIPSEELMRALGVAFNKGVDVKLITPKQSNQFLADLGRSSYMQRLVEMGVDVCLFDKKMIHAKAILFDDAVMLGSVNVDYRSLFLNYEVAIFAYSDTIIDEIKQWMEGLLQSAFHTMPARGRIRRFGENMVRMLAPLL